MTTPYHGRQRVLPVINEAIDGEQRWVAAAMVGLRLARFVSRGFDFDIHAAFRAAALGGWLVTHPAWSLCYRGREVPLLALYGLNASDSDAFSHGWAIGWQFNERFPR